MSELTISYGEVLVRLLLTAALCGLIGFERETRGQSAGFRTHILLGLGAALFTLVSAYGFTAFTEAAIESGGRGIQFDPTRIAAQIVTGIGFLGAGAIIRQGIDVRGLTTAASLWAAAAIGMAAGAGYYFGAAATTVVVVTVLYLLREVRNALLARFRTDFGVLTVDYFQRGRGINEVTEALERHGLEIRSLGAELEAGRSRYTLQLRIPQRAGGARGGIRAPRRRATERDGAARGGVARSSQASPGFRSSARCARCAGSALSFFPQEPSQDAPRAAASDGVPERWHGTLAD